MTASATGYRFAGRRRKGCFMDKVGATNVIILYERNMKICLIL